MKEKPLILAVDRNRRNIELLAQFLEKEGYSTLGASSHEEIEQTLNDSAKIGLVLLDIAGFDHRIWGLCQRFQEEQIPFLIISPRQNAAIQQESLSHGARSMLVKPLAVKDLMRLIKSLLKD